jgi:hypothetical protein
MFDGTGFNPLLTTDPNGNTFTVDLNLDGTTTPTLFRAGGQSGPVASLIVPNIPEPASGFLAIFGLAGILYICAGALSSPHAAAANQRRISARGTTPVFSARMMPRRKSTKYGID